MIDYEVCSAISIIGIQMRWALSYMKHADEGQTRCAYYALILRSLR